MWCEFAACVAGSCYFALCVDLVWGAEGQCHDNTGSWIESLPPGSVQLVQNSGLQSVQIRSSPILNLISSVLPVQVLSRFR